MLESVEWGEYKLGDLFEIKISKSIDEGKVILSPNYQPGLIEFIGRTTVDNGVKGYTRELCFNPNPPNVLSVSQIGTITAQIRSNYWYASQNIFLLAPKTEDKQLLSLFVISAINKALQGSFDSGYSNYPTLLTLQDLKIKLPSCNGEIDYEFMDRFIAELKARRIAELKARRIAELKAYLTITGLEDYTLTPEEEQAIKDFEAGNVKWGEYSFDMVFNHIKQGRRLKKDDQQEGTIPFVMAGVSNTGVVNYISNPIAIFPSNSITIDIFGNTFYRNYEFGAGDDTGVYWNTSKSYSKELMLFFATAMSRALVGKYSFGKKLRSSQSLKEQMLLLDYQGSPDYIRMETFISAVQKLVIKDVVLYADREIEATQQVVDQS